MTCVDSADEGRAPRRQAAAGKFVQTANAGWRFGQAIAVNRQMFLLQSSIAFHSSSLDSRAKFSPREVVVDSKIENQASLDARRRDAVH